MKLKFFGVLVCMMLAMTVGCGSDPEGDEGGAGSGGSGQGGSGQGGSGQGGSGQGGSGQGGSGGAAAGDFGSCGEILRCWEACEDDTCAKACDDGYPEPVVAAWEDLWWCNIDESCDYTTTCIEELCAAEVAACKQASSN